MSYLHCTDRVRRYRVALFASCAFSAGALALSSAPAMAGCNSGNSPSSAILHGEGCQANASGASSTAVSKFATSGNYSVAVGVSSLAGASANAVGFEAVASDYGVAVGYKAKVSTSSAAVGLNAGDQGIAGNALNSAFGTNTGREVTGINNTAIGAAAGQLVDGQGNTAVGLSAARVVTGNNNAALGSGAGHDVTGNGNVAIGQNAGISITASQTVAIGINTRATANKAIAIGSGSVADVANTVSVGTNAAKRRIVNVAAAVNPTDAVNFAQAKQLASASMSAETTAGEASALKDVRREIAELRGLVRQQQARIAQLERDTVSAARAH
jgi:trimeric autotransporter adhesin